MLHLRVSLPSALLLLCRCCRRRDEWSRRCLSSPRRDIRDGNAIRQTLKKRKRNYYYYSVRRHAFLVSFFHRRVVDEVHLKNPNFHLDYINSIDLPDLDIET